jgi:hypothetical protein
MYSFVFLQIAADPLLNDGPSPPAGGQDASNISLSEKLSLDDLSGFGSLKPVKIICS